MVSTSWVSIAPGVAVDINEDVITFVDSDRRIQCKARTDQSIESIKLLQQSIINVETLPTKKLFSQLRDLNLLTEGSNPAHVLALKVHGESSFPLNRGMEYSTDEIKLMQENAKKRRFKRFGPLERTLNVPLSLVRTRSFPVDEFVHKYSPLSDEFIEEFLSTLYNPENPLHPSPGALYPISILIEQCTDFGSAIWSYDYVEGKISKSKFCSPLEHSDRYDPLLLEAPTKIWFVAKLDDITYKYGLRGYRYALIEAGHVAQLIIQLLNSHGIQCRPFGGYDDSAVGKHLGLPKTEPVVYSLGVFYRNVEPWVAAEEVRYGLVNGQAIHYAESYGGKDDKGRPIKGFGIDLQPDRARLKSQAELAERIALIKCPKPLGNSNGMAAHLSLARAIENSTLELYERHCFLNIWLTKTSGTKIVIPNTRISRIAQALTRMASAQVALVDIHDQLYGIPCVMAVVYSDLHGGILTSSAADLLEERAVERAFLELAKGLLYRKFIDSPLFLDNVDIQLNSPEDHEAWYTRKSIPKSETEFLMASTVYRHMSNELHDLSKLSSIVSVDDLSSFSPEPNRWKVVRVTTDSLLTLEFGEPSSSYWDRAKKLLGSKLINYVPHPIG